MKLDKLAPWNWFRKEEEMEERSVPVKRRASGEGMSHPVVRLQNEIDRLFDDFFRGFPDPSRVFYRLFPTPAAEFFRPTMDIAATDAEYTLTVELPGVDEKDVSIELDGDTLKIRGEKKQEKEEKEKNWHRIERSYGSFQRVLSLPEDARGEDITAKFSKGVLTVTIPRVKTEKPEPKKIPISS
jgi:HSP20 family protein